MNREIKFRAWEKDTKQMHEVVQLDFNNWVAIPVPEAVDDEGGVDWILEQRRIGDVELMQYTDLKDKNGKEIYESDYLGDWCVFWGSGQYILQNISTGDIMMCNEISIEGKEITGNRYENPREHKAMASDL